jgi:hypothetical protein
LKEKNQRKMPLQQDTGSLLEKYIDKRGMLWK